MLYEVSRTQDYLSELLGEDEYLVRVPYGAINERVQGLIQVPVIMWSVDPTSGRVMSSDRMRDGIVSTRARWGNYPHARYLPRKSDGLD